MGREVRNLTPHTIILRAPDGSETSIPASGQLARVETAETLTGSHLGLPVISRVLGAVAGLPDSGAVLVSAMVLAACPGRPDTYAPDTGPTAIRDTQGRIVAVTRLVAA